MPDHLAAFPRDSRGVLRDGIYHFIRHRQLPDAIALGWIPVPPRHWGEYADQFSVLCHWVMCACGRGMPVPR